MVVFTGIGFLNLGVNLHSKQDLPNIDRTLIFVALIVRTITHLPFCIHHRTHSYKHQSRI